jgi:putative DNA primase/helicase
MTVMSFPVPEPITAAGLSPEFSDDALGLEFTARHAGELRYVAGFGTWLRWDGTRWVFEKTLAAYDLARAVARDFANACPHIDDKKKIASAKTVAAIERLARSDRRHAATVDIWDADPWLLNTPTGIVNLRTGMMLPHDPLAYMTKITPAAPDGTCPRWRQFLAEITDNDEELQRFLQRIAGYSLTGTTRDHALFFFYGTGGNGKGVFLNTLSAVFGDYAAVAPMEAFIATQGERHPTDLAGLRGARLVTSQETEEGRRWAESKIKALTGGDPISARFMRQDFFTYLPQFKLVIAGNHKPGLRGVDEAIRRRLHLVPFTVTIKKPDRHLPEKLREEWPGILQWAIAGCLTWQSEGLNPPKKVLDATDAYLGDEDALARWIEDCCVTNPGKWCPSSWLWKSWKRWAESNNERAGSQKSFGMALDGKGYERSKENDMRGYKGIALKPQPIDLDLNDADEQPPENG